LWKLRLRKPRNILFQSKTRIYLLFLVLLIIPIGQSIGTAQTELTSAQFVTLKLYVHETCVNGQASLAPLLAGASVSGTDGDKNAFAETTNVNGYAEIKGAPGKWIFTASKTGYGTATWSQEINKAETRHVCLVADIVLGIDVCSATVDWEEVYNAGFKFAFVKSSAGTKEWSPFSNYDLKDAKEQGMNVGVYHLGMPGLNSAKSEAEAFVKIAKPYLTSGYLRPVLDIEVYVYNGEKRNPYELLGQEVLSSWVKTWVDTVLRETTIKPILYTGSWVKTEKWFDSTVINKYDLWVSDYGPLTGVYPTDPRIGQWNTWAFWQYDAGEEFLGRDDVPGVTGNADLNRFNGSATELESFVIRGVGLSSTKKALQWLRTSQKDSGSWSESTGITALVLLSFFNAGFTPDDPVDTDGDGTPDLKEGMIYLSNHFDEETSRFHGDFSGTTQHYCYDTSLCILALIAADRGSGTNNYEDVISKAKDYLLSVQYDDNTADPDYGGWGYPRAGWADLSNTQWVVMALDAAYDYLGLTKPSPATSGTWTNKLLTFLDHCQMDDGGFDYKQRSQNSYGSMSYAGLWSLLLAGLHEPELRISRVHSWISNNYTLDENPGRGSTALYYYYVSLAKALTMAGWSTITDSTGSRHDWYAELENKLEPLQDEDGYWVNTDDGAWEGNKDLCTAYALLALETQQLPHGEQLSWVLTLHSPGTLHVYSPDGAHVGPNSVEGGVDEDIPGSSYTVDPTGEQVITISGLEAGAYRVQLVGTSSGAYTLDSVVKESDRVVSSKSFTGTLLPGQARVTRAVFTAMEGAVTQFMGDLQATPAGLTATSGNEIVNLTWTPFTETDFVLAGYNVYRSTTPGGEYVKITVSPVDVASYRDAGLPNDITYYYVVTAVSSAGSETPYSPEVQATPSLGMSGQNAKIICGPNPVSAAGVTFFYALPVGTTEAQIMIFDIPGRLLFKDWLDPTEERYPASGTWDLISLNGTPLGNGAYTFVLIADGKAVAQGKMVIQR
jgi:squalene-hopene/tetraprenyl-beta-curcumene cyclase